MTLFLKFKTSLFRDMSFESEFFPHMLCERNRHLFFAVHYKDLGRVFEKRKPSHEFRLVCVRRETINRIDGRPDRNFVAKNAHGLRPFNNLPSKRPFALISDEDDAALTPPEIISGDTNLPSSPASGDHQT
jgi:hypothetical protein